MSTKSAPKREAPAKSAIQMILVNKRLRFAHEVLDTWEAGLVLMGSEVKSMRAGDVQWAGAHARLDRDGQVWLYDLHIGEYKQAAVFGHLSTQPRKLLLKRAEIVRLAGKVGAKGLTILPEQLYFKGGWAKMLICLCRGKTHEDKRADLVKTAQKRDVEREMARRLKRG